MHVFISYARRDQATIAAVRADFERLGQRTWHDRESHGGQRWWDDVLGHVRGCAAFVFVLSPDALRSKACLAELRYARALRKPVLAVAVRPVERDDFPPELGGVEVVDYLDPGTETPIALRKAFGSLPSVRALPARMPPEPAIPTSYLSAHLARGDGGPLDGDEQVALLDRLCARLADEEERARAWDLIVDLRTRPELTPRVAAAVEEILAPGWRPDPRGAAEVRYWDGQSWTTLVRHRGREFDDRYQHRSEPSRAPGTGLVVSARPAPARRSRSVPLLVGAAALVVAGGVAGGVVLLGDSAPDAGAATQVARNFVDAVNTRDESAVRLYVCDRDQGDGSYLYGAFLETANLTLESVDAGGAQPTFTILAARTVGNSSVKLNIPLAEENGEWRVCDIGQALSGR